MEARRPVAMGGSVLAGLFGLVLLTGTWSWWAWQQGAWFGVVLLGLFAGNVMYGGGKRPALFAGKVPVLARPLLPLGRNSLFIYLIHQPVIIIALLTASGVVDLNFL